MDWQKGFYWWFVSTFKGVLLWSSNSKNSVPVFRNQEPRGTSGSPGGQDNIPHAVLNLMLIERIVNILDGWWMSWTVLQDNMSDYKEENWVSVAAAVSQRRLLVRRRRWEHSFWHITLVPGRHELMPESDFILWHLTEGHVGGSLRGVGHTSGEKDPEVDTWKWRDGFFTVYKFHPVVMQSCNCYVVICRWFASMQVNIHVKVRRDQKHFLIYSWSLSLYDTQGKEVQRWSTNVSPMAHS